MGLICACSLKELVLYKRQWERRNPCPTVTLGFLFEDKLDNILASLNIPFLAIMRILSYSDTPVKVYQAGFAGNGNLLERVHRTLYAIFSLQSLR